MNKSVNALLLASCLGLVPTTPVLAEGDSDGKQFDEIPVPAPRRTEADQLQEVVVTARKQSENIQTVPVSVTAISGDQLKERSIQTVANLQNVAPGLFIQQSFDDPQSIVVTMRGRKQDDATMAVDSSVNLSVDGVNFPRTLGMTGSMLDIQRVEVLRGPQGTLYGRNSTGGAIGIYTNDPTHDLSGSIDVMGGNYGTYNVVGIFNLPVSESVDARFVAQRDANGGYATNAVGTGLNAASGDYFRGKLRWHGDDNWQAVIAAHYEHDHSGGVRGFISALDPANFQGNGLPVGGFLTLQTMAQLGVSAAQAVALENSWVAQRSPWYTLVNTPGAASSYSEVKRSDLDLNISGDIADHAQFHSTTGVQYFTRDNFLGPQSAVVILDSNTKTTGRYFSQELQLLGNTPTLKWVAGAYGGIETGSEAQYAFFLPAVSGGLGANSANGIRNTTLAGYAQATWEFIPAWHLTTGARYTADTRRVDATSTIVSLVDPTVNSCTIPAPGVEVTPPGASQCPRRFSADFSRPTWLASLDRQFSDVLLYAKVATGYRSGGLNEPGANEVETFGAFAPETNIEYEIGFKSEFFNRRVRLNANVYWDNYSNLQVTTAILGADNTPLTLVANAAKAAIRGMELEGDVIVGWGVRMHASTAYTGAHYIHYEDLNGDHSHQPFSVPRWTFNFGPDYTRPTSIGDVSVDLNYTWKSAVNVVPTTTLAQAGTQGGYGLLNARANLHLDAWNMDFAVFGQNLANKVYFDQGVNPTSPGFDLPWLYMGGPPRTYGAEIIKKFGQQP